MANGQTAGSVKVGGGESFLSGGTGDDLLIAEAGSWTTTFVGLNGSGVTGTARISLEGDALRVQVAASGLEPGQPHAMHIHGRAEADGTPLDSEPGTPALDSDGDGLVELAEGRVAQGPPILTLGTPTAAADGTVSFDQTFALDADLFPMDFRLVEIHGLSVDAGAGAGTGGEVDGTAGYKALLPVAAGAIEDSPLATFAAVDPTDDGILMAGGNGRDVLVGGRAADVLVGGRGNDVLAGGAGDDDLVGGRGADRFIVGDNKDTISDFRPADGDRIDFGADVEVSDLFARQTAQGLWLTIGDGALSDPDTEGVLLVSVRATSGAEVAGWLA